eukprot:Skav228594  [mRNA]  locus=scaffold1161:75892:85912:+ [translate_table: standard]
MLFAFGGTMMEWQWPELAYLSVVGFCGLLRTGEMFHLRRKHVVLPHRKDQGAVLFLEDTKTSQRNHLLWEKVIIEEKVAIACLRRLCDRKRASDLLVSTSVVKYRDIWKQVVTHLGLSCLHYIPYSLRRGGATSNYRQGATLDQLVEKGRWKHIPTARLYLDQGLQEFASLSIPPQAVPKIRAAQRKFKAAGQDNKVFHRDASRAAAGFLRPFSFGRRVVQEVFWAWSEHIEKTREEGAPSRRRKSSFLSIINQQPTAELLQVPIINSQGSESRA